MEVMGHMIEFVVGLLIGGAAGSVLMAIFIGGKDESED